MPLTILQAAGTQPGPGEPEEEGTNPQWTRRQMLSSADRLLSPAHKPAEPKKLPRLVARRRLSPGTRRRVHARTSPARAQPCSLLRMSGKGAERRPTDWQAEASARRRSPPRSASRPGPPCVTSAGAGRSWEGGTPAAGRVFVLEAQLMLAGGGDARPRKRRSLPLPPKQLRPASGQVARGGPAGRQAGGEGRGSPPGCSFGPPGLLMSPRRALPGREGGETPRTRAPEGDRHQRQPRSQPLRGARCSPSSSGLVGFAGPHGSNCLVFLVQLRAVSSTPEPRSRGSLSRTSLGSRCSTVPGCLSESRPCSTYMIHRRQCT